MFEIEFIDIQDKYIYEIKDGCNHESYFLTLGKLSLHTEENWSTGSIFRGHQEGTNRILQYTPYFAVDGLQKDDVWSVRVQSTCTPHILLSYALFCWGGFKNNIF